MPVPEAFLSLLCARNAHTHLCQSPVYFVLPISIEAGSQFAIPEQPLSVSWLLYGLPLLG